MNNSTLNALEDLRLDVACLTVDGPKDHDIRVILQALVDLVEKIARGEA